MTIDIRDDQNLESVPLLRARLLDSLRPDADVVLDVAGVTGASFAFLQMIESARRQADRVGARLSLAAPAGGTLLEALRRAGFLFPVDRPDACFWTNGAATA